MSESESTAVQERFADADEHTVIDMKRKLVWLKQDTYQMTGKWLNWVQSRDYAKELSQSHFAATTTGGFPQRMRQKVYSTRNRRIKIIWVKQLICILFSPVDSGFCVGPAMCGIKFKLFASGTARVG